MNDLVLIVEDNADVAASTAALLALYGIPSATAGTLAGALLRLAAGGVSCVVLDLTLPDAAGISAVERLVAAYPPVPLVVFTGHAEMELPALRAGAQEVLTKASDPEALVRAVRFAVERHKVRRQFKPYVEALENAVAKVEQALEAVDKGLPPGTLHTPTSMGG